MAVLRFLHPPQAPEQLRGIDGGVWASTREKIQM
jgi:hypothetical protein